MEYMEDLVSVVIPMHNNQDFIKQTLDSVLNQTYKNLEIIMVDDCSTDSTCQIVEPYARDCDQISLVRQTVNQGAAVTRNEAIARARGRYIAFLDSDDVWKPEKLVKQLAYFEKAGGVICYTGIDIMDESGAVVKPDRKVIERVDYKFLLKNTIIATSTVIVDRKISGDFAMPLLRAGQDYATWLMLLRKTGSYASGLSESLTLYRRRSGSISSKKFRRFKKVWDIQVKFENIHPAAAALNCVHYAFNAFKKHYL